MKPDQSKTGRRPQESHTSPRLGLCQILAQRLQDARPRPPFAANGETPPGADATRLHIQRMTRQ
jgi:hypothetical protein